MTFLRPRAEWLPVVLDGLTYERYLAHQHQSRFHVRVWLRAHFNDKF